MPDWLPANIGILVRWIGEHAWPLFGVSAALFLASLLLIRMLLIRMPVDYFSSRRPSPTTLRVRHPALRLLAIGVKNLVGLVCLVIGTIMIFTPGQGILAILMGVSLMNFPGKRLLELRIVGQPIVRRTIDAIRHRAGRPPLVL